MSRWRVQLRISEDVRWLSHLDILSMIERGFRRAKLPVAYSEGFNPHMLISWGPAHPVGLAGDAEYFDIDFSGALKENWYEELNQLLPQGLEVIAGRELKEKTPALMSSINRAEYRITISQLSEEDMERGIEEIMAAVTLPLKRRSPKGEKTVDIRPGIISLSHNGLDLILFAALGTGSSPKPQEVAILAAPQGRVEYIRRTGMFIDNNGVIIRP